MAARDRLIQGLAALNPTIPWDRDALLSDWLTPAQADVFRALPSHDQAHLVRVTCLLLDWGVRDRDVIVAALLHDIAKNGTPEVPGRVHLPERALAVLLRPLAPKLLERLADPDCPAWRRGLALAVHHAELGSDLARRLGCSERACWLIAHHDAEPLPDDPDLRLLRRADDLAV